MTTFARQNPIPKSLALILVSLFGGWVMLRLDASALAKLNSMSAADYVEKQRLLHNHSFIFHFTMALMMGGFYIGIVEFFACVIRLLLPKKTV